MSSYDAIVLIGHLVVRSAYFFNSSIVKSGVKELTVDTLVLRYDEGRGYQRNVSRSWKHTLTREYPNKATSTDQISKRREGWT